MSGQYFEDMGRFVCKSPPRATVSGQLFKRANVEAECRAKAQFSCDQQATTTTSADYVDEAVGALEFKPKLIFKESTAVSLHSGKSNKQAKNNMPLTTVQQWQTSTPIRSNGHLKLVTSRATSTVVSSTSVSQNDTVCTEPGKIILVFLDLLLSAVFLPLKTQ